MTPSPEPRTTIRIGRILAPLLGGLAISIMDLTLVMVALPAIQADLGVAVTRAGWIPTTYLLTFATALLPFGRLGDSFGQKRMFLLGAAGFAMFSALCMLAPSFDLLIAGRALQGLAGAMMVPQIMAAVAILLPASERQQAFSHMAAVGSLAAVTGPLLGGLILAADVAGLGWRSAFLANALLAMLVLVAGLRLIPPIAVVRRQKVDAAGALLFGLAVVLLVYPLMEARTIGWQPWLLIMAIGSAPVLVVFHLWQGRQAHLDRAQLLPASLLGDRRFLGNLARVAVFFAGIPGLIMIISLTLQTGYGLTPLHAGLVTSAFPLGVLMASLVGGRMAVRNPMRRIGAGCLALAVGMIALHIAFAVAGDAVAAWRIAGPLLLCGAGMGISVPILFQMVMEGVPGAHSGAASGASQTLQHVGSAVGIAVTTQLFFGALPRGAETGAPAGASDFTHAAAFATWFQVALYSAAALMLLLRLATAPNPKTELEISRDAQ